MNNIESRKGEINHIAKFAHMRRHCSLTIMTQWIVNYKV